MHVYGNDWGLACNGIHFLDLFTWLNGVDQISFNTNRLDHMVYESKREGFVEFYGNMEGIAKGAQVQLTCLDHSGKEILIILKTSKITVTINEKRGWAVFTGNRSGVKSHFQDFEMPKISEIMKLIVGDILNNKSCRLPR